MGVLKTYFQQGGPIMYLLLALSILAIFIFFERLIVYIKKSINTRQFLGMLIELMEQDKTDEAMELCEQTKGPVAKVLHEGLVKYQDLQKISSLKLKAQDKKELVERTMEGAATLELSALEKNLVWLATVISLAPIFGFTGTVTGMIGAFKNLATTGLGDPSVVASGISEALITTATGLLIAAPVMIIYNVFISWIDKFTFDIQEASTVLLEIVEEKELTK